MIDDRIEWPAHHHPSVEEGPMHHDATVETRVPIAELPGSGRLRRNDEGGARGGQTGEGKLQCIHLLVLPIVHLLFICFCRRVAQSDVEKERRTAPAGSIITES
jgi:hypothetical protein